MAACPCHNRRPAGACRQRKLLCERMLRNRFVCSCMLLSNSVPKSQPRHSLTSAIVINPLSLQSGAGPSHWRTGQSSWRMSSKITNTYDQKSSKSCIMVPFSDVIGRFVVNHTIPHQTAFYQLIGSSIRPYFCLWRRSSTRSAANDGPPYLASSCFRRTAFRRNRSSEKRRSTAWRS